VSTRRLPLLRSLINGPEAGDSSSATDNGVRPTALRAHRRGEAYTRAEADVILDATGKPATEVSEGGSNG
jgi:hypothetical protein